MSVGTSSLISESQKAQIAALELKVARDRRMQADKRWRDAMLTHRPGFVGTPVDNDRLNAPSAEAHCAVIESYEAWQRKESRGREQ